MERRAVGASEGNTPTSTRVVSPPHNTTARYQADRHTRVGAVFGIETKSNEGWRGEWLL